MLGRTNAQSSAVTGVKGNNESTYRQGNVNVTPSNIGLGNVENKSSEDIRDEITKANVTTALGLSPASCSATTVTLPVNGWSNKTITVTVAGVTTGNNVIVTPGGASKDAYSDAGVWCSAQAQNSLTFTCETTPSSAITVNVLVLTSS